MPLEFDIIKEVVGRLDCAGIPYMITGSIAANFYATPRMTRDIDVVMEFKEEDVERFCGIFEEDFYVDRGMIMEALRKTGMFNIIHYQSVFKVDCIIRKNDDYRREEFKRRRKIKVAGTELYIVAPEDLILSKLRWIKEGASDLQAGDVKNILRQTKNLDEEYLSLWAEYLGVEELYGKVKQ